MIICHSPDHLKLIFSLYIFSTASSPPPPPLPCSPHLIERRRDLNVGLMRSACWEGRGRLQPWRHGRIKGLSLASRGAAGGRGAQLGQREGRGVVDGVATTPLQLQGDLKPA